MTEEYPSPMIPDDAHLIDAYLEHLREQGIRFVSIESLARAIVQTLPYETFQTPEKYADALLVAHDELVEVAA